MRPCCISGCERNKRSGLIKMCMFPKIQNQTETFRKLSKQRQLAWLSALGKPNADPASYENYRVCEAHFISGKSASTQDINNVDWVPTLNLSHLNNRGSDSLRCSVYGCVASNKNGQCSFYRIPKINCRGELKEISEKSLSEWISVLGIRTDDPTPHGNVYVCQAHYIMEMSGKLRDTIDTISLDSDSSESAEHLKKNVVSVKVRKLPNVRLCGNDSKKKQSRNQPLSTTTTKDLKSFKSGEILRNEKGKFTFLCSYCNAVRDDCRDMINHINEHFEENINTEFETNKTPEFVSCTNTEAEVSETYRESTNTMTTAKLSNDCGELFTMKLGKLGTPQSLKRRFDQIQENKSIETNSPPKKSLVQSFASNTLPKSFKIKLPYLPVGTMQSDPPRSAGWTFGKNYEIIYKNRNSNVDPNKIDKRKGIPDPRILECTETTVNDFDRTPFLINHQRIRSTKCYQCEMEPAITNESDPRRHKCVFCKEWLPNHIEFKTHFQDAHNENVETFFRWPSECREYTCYICEKNVKHRDYLVSHVKSHFDKFLEYQCHICGLRVRTESVLREHMKRHDEITAECDVCNKVFPSYMKMRSHRLCHTSELNYVCTICSKGFKLGKYLTRHMAVHKEVKILCRYCDASFKFSTGRRAHEKSVHNVV